MTERSTQPAPQPEPAAALPDWALAIPAPVPSPCVSLCKYDRDTRVCEGCLRTIDEIIAWGEADDDFKRAVWVAIKQREAEIDFD